jgi:hypothetical protein
MAPSTNSKTSEKSTKKPAINYVVPEQGVAENPGNPSSPLAVFVLTLLRYYLAFQDSPYVLDAHGNFPREVVESIDEQIREGYELIFTSERGSMMIYRRNGWPTRDR